MSAINVDSITPRHARGTRIGLASLAAPVINGGSITGAGFASGSIASCDVSLCEVHDGTVTDCAVHDGTLTSCAIGTSTITSCAINTGTLSGCSLLVTQANYVVTGFHSDSAANQTMSTYATFTSPIVIFSMEGFTGTGGGSALAFTTALPAALWPSVEQRIPVYAINNVTPAWGTMFVTTAGNVTFVPGTAATGTFTDAVAAYVNPCTVQWSTQSYA